MKKYQKISIHIFLVLSFLIMYGNASFNHNLTKKDNLDKENLNNNTLYKMNSFSRRRMEEEPLVEEEEEHIENLSYVPANIFLDLYNFNETFPEELGDSEIFIKAMNKAKDLLKEAILINTDLNGEIKYDDIDYSDWWEIEYFNEDVFKKIYLKDFNYYIIFSFDENIDSIITSTILDVFGDTPIVGKIIINPDKLKDYISKSDFFDYLTNYFFHHFIHLLGFHIDVEVPVWGGIVREENIGSKTYYYVNSTNIIIYARKYFDCSSITRIYLEENPNDSDDENIYWPSRLLLGELMTTFDYPAEQILSGFTLAFLEDLPYIHVIQNFTGGLMRFGKNKGCNFINEDCGANLDDKITFANEFYLPSNLDELPNPFEPSCSSSRLSKTVHVIYEAESEPSGAQYYITGYTGPEKTNYCPISEYNEQDSNSNIYIGHCSFESSANTEFDDNVLKESFTSSSFCVLSSLINKEIEGYETKSKVRAVCHEMFCSSQSLTIIIGEYYIVCPRAGGKIEVENFEGFLLCPDYNLICTGTSLCNNIFDCFTLNSEEKESSFDYTDYTIKTTQNSAVYTSETPEISNNYELTTNDGKCPYLCKLCKEGKICVKCAPHYEPDETTKTTCEKIDPNCVEYLDDETNKCKNCNSGYFIAKEDDVTFICQSNDKINQYYYISNDISLPFTYYEKCYNSINYCLLCESQTKCTQCNSANYVLVDDGTICGNLSTLLYYWDATANQYRSCSKHMSNCNKCKLDNDGNFQCVECDENYALFYEGSNPIECTLKTTKDLTKYYTKDEGINYFFCKEYNKATNCDTCENEEECETCITDYTLVNDKKLCFKADDKKYIQDADKNNYYYPCSDYLDDCLKCDNKQTCIECVDNDHLIDENDNCIDKSLFDQHYFYQDGDKYASCSKITQCVKCLSADECISCIEGYYLLEGSDNAITCQNVDITKCYSKSTSDKIYYIKCDRDMNNCDTCSGSGVCTTCKENYVFIDDDHTKCEDFRTQKYYYDSSSGKYKLCSNGLDNCETCIIDNNNFICKQCKSDFVIKHENDIECAQKSTLINNNQFYTNDSQINYYSCKLYNDIEKCLECTNKETCTKCQNTYTLVSLESIDNKACILQEDIDEHKYYHDTGTDIYTRCSSLISECNKCSDRTTCTECLGDAKLEEHNICIPNSDVIANLYYLDVTINKYASCSKISQCKTCLSSTNCLQCNDGYVIIEENDASICKDFSTKKYYYDSLLNKYKECSYKFQNCDRCVVDEGNNFICEECKSNYVFKHDNILECSLKNDLETNKEFYTNDSGINYYSCSNSLYNDVLYCKECNEKSKCMILNAFCQVMSRIK